MMQIQTLSEQELFNQTPMGQIFPIWHSAETEAHEVLRWAPYVEKNPKLRKQVTGRHILSVGLATKIVLIRLVKYAPYDRALLALAFDLHDLPEGFLKGEKILPK